MPLQPLQHKYVSEYGYDGEEEWDSNKLLKSGAREKLSITTVQELYQEIETTWVLKQCYIPLTVYPKYFNKTDEKM